MTNLFSFNLTHLRVWQKTGNLQTTTENASVQRWMYRITIRTPTSTHWQWNVMHLWACWYGTGTKSNDNVIIIIIILYLNTQFWQRFWGIGSVTAPRRSQLPLWIFGRGLVIWRLTIYLPIGAICAFNFEKMSWVGKEDRRAKSPFLPFCSAIYFCETFPPHRRIGRHAGPPRLAMSPIECNLEDQHFS